LTAASYAILIPARFASERLPGKVLLRESGRPLVQHVVERAWSAPGSPRVIVLTDDERVEEAVRAFGGEVLRTSPSHASGTDRCAEAARALAQEVLVDVQGDEPLFEPRDLARLARAVAEEGADIATLGWPFADRAQAADLHAVKAVRDAAGWALGFCRRLEDAEALAAGGRPPHEILHHVGIYAFRRGRLLAFPDLPRSAREAAERLEQLRALEQGWRIRVLDASAPAFGVDTRADYEAFLRRLREQGPRAGGTRSGEGQRREPG
jgi:3-deoxy-manno-octulosonate cytidylyltransferase (CMP-KDO synthetase)